MGREILFKAQRTDTKEWVKGCLLIDYVSGQYFIHALGNCLNESDKVGEEGCLKFFAYEVDQGTVCQYTGLTDKNGKKIFEGDIVEWHREDIILTGNYTYCFSGYKYGDKLIVRCLESGFMLCRKNDGLPDVPNANDKIDNYAFWNKQGFLEVIGNIFDNPELLNQ